MTVVCSTVDTTRHTNDALDAINVMNTVNAIMVSYSRYEYLQVGSHSSAGIAREGEGDNLFST